VKSKNKRNQIIFEQRIRKLRLKRGLTQVKLAKVAHMDQSYTADVERGERNLSLLNILKLAAALRVHPSKLFVKF
jgi:transcriptional regulator with XRE-family HTH domain